MEWDVSSLSRISAIRTVRIAACAVACIALCVPVALAARSRATAGSTPRCATANLRVDRIGQTAFTSHRSWDLALRNIGSTTCRLKGYPRVRLLDSSARPMPTTVAHVSGPPHTVTLQPFHRAFFSFTYAVSAPCPGAVLASGVRIKPPGASRRLVWYQGQFDLCGPGPATVSVSPVMKNKPF